MKKKRKKNPAKVPSVTSFDLRRPRTSHIAHRLHKGGLGLGTQSKTRSLGTQSKTRCCSCRRFTTNTGRRRASLLMATRQGSTDISPMRRQVAPHLTDPASLQDRRAGGKGLESTGTTEEGKQSAAQKKRTRTAAARTSLSFTGTNRLLRRRRGRAQCYLLQTQLTVRERMPKACDRAHTSPRSWKVLLLIRVAGRARCFRFVL
jgi:hypothetical protein